MTNNRKSVKDDFLFSVKVIPEPHHKQQHTHTLYVHVRLLKCS